MNARKSWLVALAAVVLGSWAYNVAETYAAPTTHGDRPAAIATEKKHKGDKKPTLAAAPKKKDDKKKPGTQLANAKKKKDDKKGGTLLADARAAGHKKKGPPKKADGYLVTFETA